MVIGHLLLLSACGGDNDNATEGPKPASLEGDRVEAERTRDGPSRYEREAPTEAHKKLSALIPPSGLVHDSVQYIGWDGANAAPTGDAENAPIPAISMEYQSAGWNIVDDEERQGGGSVQYKYPQKCRFVLIRAPEAGRMAGVIEENIIANLQGKGFSRISSLTFEAGLKSVRVPRYARIDDAGELDNVYIAYVKVVGDIVIYAIESEHPRKIDGPDDEKLSMVTEGGLGTRIGAQYLALVYDKLNP